MKADGRTGGRADGLAGRTMRIGVAAALLTASPPDRLYAQSDAAAILDRAVSAYRGVTTLRADFTQLVRDPVLVDEQTSRGEFLQQRPNRFAMRWSQPRGDLILADGENLWVYLPSSAPNQVVRSTLTGRGGQSADVVAEFLDRPRDRFAVAFERAEAVAGRAADVLALTPRERNTAYRRVLIWVDRQDAMVRRIEISEASGLTRRITFDRLRVNAAIAASAFTFQPPRGARIVDATQ